MDAFSKVDDLVSKPILGSEGAKAWQEFAKDSHNKGALARGLAAKKSSSAAPQAPLKAQERSMGFTNWQQEQEAEGKRRLEQGLQIASAGYTHFKKKQPPHEKQQQQKDKATGGNYDDNYIDNYNDNNNDNHDDNNNDKKQQSATSHDTPNTTTATTTTTSDRPSKKRKGAAAAAAAVTVVHDPTHPLEQVSAALQQKQQKAASYTATALPPGWHSAQDATSGKTYFYHATTGQRSWEKPFKTTDTATPSNNSNITLPKGWTTAQDPCTGNTYYYHASTKIVQWHPPNQQA